MNTLLDLLHEHVDSRPNVVALSFLDDYGDISSSLTYSQIWLQSRSLAQFLLKQPGISPGDRILLVYPPSLDFIVAFLGCLHAGLIAVPTFPPDPTKLNKDLSMFSTISNCSSAKVALTSTLYSYATKIATFQNYFSSKQLHWPELSWVVTDKLVLSEDSTPLPSLSPSDIAFLQFTSGSTSEPKGVRVSHGNLLHNLSLIHTGLAADNNTVVVSWLPQYHDMGLIGSLLGLLTCGGRGFYMSPLSFIRNPPLWVWAISKYRGTHMQAPSFAFGLTAKKFLAQTRGGLLKGSAGPSSLSGLSRGKRSLDWEGFDLSSVKHMINAAEPVDPSSLDLFLSVFSPYNLPNTCIFPTYGLAEHTVFVCTNGKGKLTVERDALERGKTVKVVDLTSTSTTRLPSDSLPPSSVLVLMGCGRPAHSDGLDLKIVCSTTLSALPEGQVGEIWLRSPSKACGYWAEPGPPGQAMREKSQADFQASLSGVSTTDGFLRTGDLGFLMGGELYICGREKDLIIVRGRNIYPQDIERHCESLLSPSSFPFLRGGCSAAFSVPVGGEESLVYVAEVSDQFLSSSPEPDFSSLLSFLRSQLSSSQGVTPSSILLIKPHSIPKTTSGKIARQWVRRHFMSLKGGSSDSTQGWGQDGILAQWSEGVEDMPTQSGSSRSLLPILQELTQVDSDSLYLLLASAEPVDPTTRSLPEVLFLLVEVVRGVVGKRREEIDVMRPMMNLGLDSIMGATLQASLEARFTVSLPDQVLMEPDATLLTLARVLHNGGEMPPRAILVRAWEAVHYARQTHLLPPPQRTINKPGRPPLPFSTQLPLFLKEIVESHLFFLKRTFLLSSSQPPSLPRLPPQWFHESAVRANIDTGKFPDKLSRTNLARISSFEYFLFLFISLMNFAVFLWVPALFIYLFFTLPLYYSVSSLLGFFLIIYTFPASCFPPAFRLSFLLEVVCKFFSYQVIIEDPSEHPLPSNSHPIFTLSPHGVFAISPSIFMLVSEILLGLNFHLLSADAVFLVPIYNCILKMLGSLSVGRTSFLSCLKAGKAVGIIPGGIAEMFLVADKPDSPQGEEKLAVLRRKGFIKLALETGSPIIPCYCFGNTLTFQAKSGGIFRIISRMFRISLLYFWGQYGLPVPFRVPLLTVVGKSILCPLTPNPSQELIDQFHSQYLLETQRIFNKYKNMYDWDEKELTFQH